jgi:hypothetical protein
MDIDTGTNLFRLMFDTGRRDFTRSGTMFCLTTKTRASAKEGMKDELFSALRAEGFGDLIYETVNANSLSAFVKEQIAENEDALPTWLDGLVNVFKKRTVGVRRAGGRPSSLTDEGRISIWQERVSTTNSYTAWRLQSGRRAVGGNDRHERHFDG